MFNQLKAQGAKLRNGDEELDQAVQFLHDFGKHFVIEVIKTGPTRSVYN